MSTSSRAWLAAHYCKVTTLDASAPRDAIVVSDISQRVYNEYKHIRNTQSQNQTQSLTITSSCQSAPEQSDCKIFRQVALRMKGYTTWAQKVLPLRLSTPDLLRV